MLNDEYPAFHGRPLFYDLIYSRKDYASEARAIDAVIREHHPAAVRPLDAACGTSERLKFLTRFEQTGFDRNPDFVVLAQQKLPTGRFLQADLATFDLTWARSST
jgi:trans-aconitate methyltransferase